MIVIVSRLFQPAPADVSALESAISALERAISALESEINALDNSAAPWEHWAWFFTFLVVLGVAIELWIIRHDWREEMETWAIFDFIGVVRVPSRPSAKKLWVEIASVLLITLGVAGELGVGVEIGLINGALRGKAAELRSKGDELRSKSDQLLALITKQAGDAVASAKAANEELDKVKKKANELDSELSETTSQLADVEAKRAKLEQSLRNMADCTAPRVIPPWSMGFTKYFDPLKPYHDWNALIEYVPNDAETLRAVSNLNDALSSAGWHVSAKRINELFDGVEIRGFEFPNADQRHRTPEMAVVEHRAQAVADAVVVYLHSYDWDAKRGWPSDSDRDTDLIPQNGIRIRVGLYPPVTFVAPPAMKEWAEFFAKQEEQRKQEIKKREDETKKTTTPEEYANHERLMQLTRNAFAPLKSPCQPLEPLSPSTVP